MDELMERYQQLNDVVRFNPETFAQQWRELADDFDKAGRPSMASGCFSKAEWYAGVGKGYAQKLSYVEVFDDKNIVWPRRSDPNEQTLFCDTCGTWTKHVRNLQGWACGCGEMVWTVVKP